MSEHTKQYLRLLERRIELLGSLSAALQGANSAVTSCDIAGFEACLAQQESLCGETGRLNAQIESFQKRSAAEASEGDVSENRDWGGKLRELLERFRLAADIVKHTNKSNQSVVRRSMRTVTALLNALQTFEGNYANSAILQSKKPSGLGGQV